MVALLVGLLRCAAGVVGGLLHAGPAGVMLLVAASWGVTATVAWWVAGRPIPAGRVHLAVPVRDLLGSAAPMSGLLVVSSLDLLLVRHHLPAVSGEFTVWVLFEKIAFWGPTFIATLAYPGLARPETRKRAAVVALAGTAAVGALGTASAWALGPWLATLVGGSGFTHLGPLVWVFVAAGVATAVLQVLVYIDLAVRRRWSTLVVWVTAGALCLTVAQCHARLCRPLPPSSLRCCGSGSVSPWPAG